MKTIAILREFFPDLKTAEVKALSGEERNELAALAAIELGVEHHPTAAAAAAA